MREEKEKDGEGRLFQRMLFMPKVTHRTGGTRRTKKQSVHYRILRSYKDTLQSMGYKKDILPFSRMNSNPHTLYHSIPLFNWA